MLRVTGRCCISHSGKYIEINFNMKISFLIPRHIASCLVQSLIQAS